MKWFKNKNIYLKRIIYYQKDIMNQKEDMKIYQKNMKRQKMIY
jgi:hypothetical protein